MPLSLLEKKILELEKTLELLKPSIDFCSQLAASNNRILFVGTKRSAAKTIKEEASALGLPYIDKRWLGGTLTNWKTIRGSVRRPVSYTHLTLPTKRIV